MFCEPFKMGTIFHQKVPGEEIISMPYFSLKLSKIKNTKQGLERKNNKTQ